MDAVKTGRDTVPTRLTGKLIFIAMVLAVLMVAALYINNAYRAFRATSLPQGTIVVSPGLLEEKYGLRVNLVAVTAAGGFVDVRLKIVDGDKSKLLFADKANFPALFTAHGVTLHVSGDTQAQAIEFTSGGDLFIMYPNSGNAVQRDTPVTIVFGGIALEPIIAK